MDKGSEFALVSIFIIVFLACAGQADAPANPVSPPESRFVWEPAENLTFTWTNENFDGFYYDAKSMAGNESLTIMFDNLKDRSIPKNGIVYSTTVETVTARYSPFGEYSVIGLFGEKYLAGYPEGKSNITSKSGINSGRLHIILIDDDASYSLVMRSNLSLSEGYVLEIVDVNITGAFAILSLKKDEIEVETGTRKVEAGKNYIYEIEGLPIIAVHIDSVFQGNEKASVTINGIFQVSQYETLISKGDNPFGVMWVTNISYNSITMKNAADIVELKPGQIIDIGEINTGELKLKVADSNTLRVILYKYRLYEITEHRGATGSNNVSSWDGLNYVGFRYDIRSGNYSESLVITNITGRRIPRGGLVYTSYMDRLTYLTYSGYMASMPHSAIKINDKEPPDWSYVTFSMGGDRYIVKSNRTAGMLTAHGVTYYDLKTLGIGFIWELGEGYALRAISADLVQNPRKVRLLLKWNDVELEDVWLKEKDVYRYTLAEENETPILITYIDNVFAGSTIDVFQLRNTWFVPDVVTRIKEGDRLGVFNVTTVEPDRIVLTNREQIELKAGSRINLLGNLSFFVENSDELRFYPTNMEGTKIFPEVAMNNVSDIPYSTIPAVTISAGTPQGAGRREKTSGFEAVLTITILLTVYITGKRR